MDKNATFEKLKGLMVQQFELLPEAISLDKLLDEDLHLDSLDMVDLVLSINDMEVNKKLEPTLFKDACKVQDLVDLVHPFFL